jgi:hypothetical protein
MALVAFSLLVLGGSKFRSISQNAWLGRGTPYFRVKGGATQFEHRSADNLHVSVDLIQSIFLDFPFISLYRLCLIHFLQSHLGRPWFDY